MKRYWTFFLCLLLLFTACGPRIRPEMPENMREMGSESSVAEGDITITVRAVSFMDYYTNMVMGQYTEKHPNVHFEVLDPIDWSTRDIGISKVYTEIGRGEGPDIIIAWRDDLSNLIEKECLLDLSDAISEDTKGKLLQSVMEYGLYDGKTYLAPGNLNSSMLIVNNEYDREGAWTIAELISIIEQREKEGNPFEWIAVQAGQPAQALDVFQLFMRCLDASSFVDWDKRSCSFEDPIFWKVLEISKKYNDYANNHAPDYGINEEYELLKEGRVLAVYDPTFRLSTYSQMREILGPDYSAIGFPCDEGNGRRVVYATNMAVNKNTKYGDVIKDFINFYYSYDVCAASENEIRTDLYDGKMKGDEKDYSEEFFDLLNTFHAVDLDKQNETSKIEDIVYEEADAFFAGDRSAKEAAALIQSRVSLLLAE